jgi:hypothetical protein
VKTVSEGVVFAIGGVVFIATTWATIAFGLTRVMRLERDLATDEQVDESRPSRT